MISLKDYAKSNSISYEAIRKQVARYKDELGNHVILEGRQQFLDEEAVAFLDEKRKKNPVVIQTINKDERIEELEAELEALQKKMLLREAELQKKLAEVEKESKEAYKELKEQSRLIAESKLYIEQRDNAKKEADEVHLENQKLKTELENERTRKLTWRERLTGKKEE